MCLHIDAYRILGSRIVCGVTFLVTSKEMLKHLLSFHVVHMAAQTLACLSHNPLKIGCFSHLNMVILGGVTLLNLA
jgi:multisubunit Na+/H+ antiporter MnhC subunit